jgi:hypothetical protein
MRRRLLPAAGNAVLALSLLACTRAKDTSSLTSDTASLAGDVSMDSATTGAVFHGVKYPLTSENYRKWLVAQAALDSLPEPAAMPRVDLRDPTDDDIDRTVDFLAQQDAERRAIERSGLSVKDFVLTSIALGQALHFSKDALVPPENRVFVATNRPEIERVRAARNFHVLDDDEDGNGDGGHGGHGDKHGHGHHHDHGHGHGRGH